MPRPFLLVPAIGLALAGCSGGGSDATAAKLPPRTRASSTASAAPCPTRTATTPIAWPTGIPSDLPTPPGARVADVNPAAHGVTSVRFTTPTSLRSSVLFVVRELPRAGFRLGRGDAEAAEADAPFARPGVRGIIRLVATGACETTWLVAAATTGGGAPLLPSHSPTASTSPLPFG